MIILECFPYSFICKDLYYEFYKQDVSCIKLNDQLWWSLNEFQYM